MEIWLDTIDVEFVKECEGLIAGVTTNPTLLAQAKDVPGVLKALLNVQGGHVAVQVTRDSVEGMIAEGRAIRDFSKRCIVKVPVTRKGLHVIRTLKQEGVVVMATAVVEPSQALLAGILEVDYVAPYFSHMGPDALEKLKIMKHCFLGKILAASVKEVKDVVACSCVEAVTLKPELFRQLMNSNVEELLKKFSDNWREGPTKPLNLLL